MTRNLSYARRNQNSLGAKDAQRDNFSDGRTDNDIFRGRFLPIKSELTHNFDENVDCSDAQCVLAVVQRVDVAYQVQYCLPSIKVCVLFIAK